MRPKWMFVLGSTLLFASLVGLGVGLIFLVNLGVFILRHNGPRWGWRWEMMLSSFPWWIPVAGGIAAVAAVLLLKRYDFSYRKNFGVLLAGLVVALIISGVVLDQLGLNDYLMQGRMRRYYQQWEGGGDPVRPGRGMRQHFNRN